MQTAMQLHFYNSLTRQKEAFKPLSPPTVSMYSCGVTVYDMCHVGHARAALVAELLRKLLVYVGYEPKLVKNFTDVDDKIIHRAQQLQITPAELAEQMIQAHDQDLQALGIQPPDKAPKATDYIETMVQLIQALEQKGYAYAKEGDVFFRVHKFANYGQLSGKNIADLQAGARVEINTAKEEPLDFVLWKAAKPAEPSWPSPWGMGRPGWHIECSAMCKSLLGDSIDIHLGGTDLIFPHHENEIAQSEAVNEKPFATFWLHNGMVQNSGEKMSKSLGNFSSLRSLLKKYPKELLRFFLLSTHYRQPLHFSEPALVKANEGLERIHQALAQFVRQNPNLDLSNNLDSPPLATHSFFASLANDLHTPTALSVVFDWVKLLNSKQQSAAETLKVFKQIQQAGDFLGILHNNPEQWLKTDRSGTSPQVTEQQIEQWIQTRKQARQQQDWALADQIRDKLTQHSISIQDQDDQTIWTRKST